MCFRHSNSPILCSQSHFYIEIMNISVPPQTGCWPLPGHPYKTSWLRHWLYYISSCVCECWLCVNDLPPFVLWAVLLVSLPHVGHAHIRVEPVDVARWNVSETQPETSHVFNLMNVHDLLNDSLQTQNTQFTLIKIPECTAYCNI